MYRWLRNTHLLLGLFCCLFLLMYGASSVQMCHNSWFSAKPRVTGSRIFIRPDQEPRSAARELMDSHGLRGELAQVKKTPAGSSFRIVRPGTVYEIDYTTANGQADVRTNTANWIGMLNRIHHIRGLWHEFAILNIWGTLVALVSVSLVVLGLTGIYLWFKIHPERLIGTTLLAISLGYSLTLIILIRTA